MRDAVPGQRDHALELLGSRRQDELVLLLALVPVQGHRKPVRTLDQDGVQLLQHRMNLLVKNPLKLHLLWRGGKRKEKRL